MDLIVLGAKLECQHLKESLGAWIVNVVDNVGGRLKLRYEGLGDLDQFDFWMFCLDPFLHPVGWATQEGYVLEPPLGIQNFQLNIWSFFPFFPPKQTNFILMLFVAFEFPLKMNLLGAKYSTTY